MTFCAQIHRMMLLLGAFAPLQFYQLRRNEQEIGAFDFRWVGKGSRTQSPPLGAFLLGAKYFLEFQENRAFCCARLQHASLHLSPFKECRILIN